MIISFLFQQLGNLKPNRKELEIFDELPPLKEAQQQSKSEDSRSRTPSGTSSGYTSGDAVEKAPLLQTRTDSESSDRSHYVRLSTAGTSTMPNHSWAADALEAEAEPLVSPLDARCSSMDEGIYMSGSSSNYKQMGSKGESLLMCLPDDGVSVIDAKGQVVDWHQAHAGRGQRDRGKRNGKAKRDVNVNYIMCESSEDADDEWSIPSTPVTPGMPYYSQMGPVVTQEQNKASLDDTYVVQTIVPRSVPVRFGNQNLASVPESPDGNISVPMSGYACMNSLPPPLRSAVQEDAGYVESTNIDMITTTGTQNNPGCMRPISSPQSSPEHAVIIHTKTPRDQGLQVHVHSFNPQENLDSSSVHVGGYVDNSAISFNSQSQTAMSSYLQNKKSQPSKSACLERQDQFARRKAPSNGPANNAGKPFDGDEGYMSQESLSRVQVPADAPKTAISGTSPGTISQQGVPLQAGGYVCNDTINQKQAPAVKNCPAVNKPHGQMMKDGGYTSVEDAHQLPRPDRDSESSCAGRNKPEILVSAGRSKRNNHGSDQGYVTQEAIQQLQSFASTTSNNCSGVGIQPTVFSAVSRGQVGSSATGNTGSWMPARDGGYVCQENHNLPPTTSEGCL